MVGVNVAAEVRGGHIRLSLGGAVLSSPPTCFPSILLVMHDAAPLIVTSAI